MLVFVKTRVSVEGVCCEDEVDVKGSCKDEPIVDDGSSEVVVVGAKVIFLFFLPLFFLLLRTRRDEESKEEAAPVLLVVPLLFPPALLELLLCAVDDKGVVRGMSYEMRDSFQNGQVTFLRRDAGAPQRHK